MTGLPKMIQLEEGFGITAAHAEVVAMVEQYLDSGAWGARSSDDRRHRVPAPHRRRR